MRTQLKFLFLLLGIFITGVSKGAVDYYWMAGTASSWSTLSNWRTGSTSGPTATVLPTSADRVFFTSSGLGSCTMNSAVNVAGFIIQSGYTGTLTQQNTITVGASNFSIAGGTFSASTGTSLAITFNGTFTITGGTFNCGLGTTTFNSSFTQSGGTFAAGAGAINLTSTVTINTASGVTSAFNCNSASVTMSSSLSQSGGTLTASTGTSITSFTQSGGTFNSGNGTTITGYTQNGGTFNVSSGTTFMAGNFTYTAGTFTHNNGLLKFTKGGSISGSVTLYRLELSSNGAAATTYTISAGSTFTVNTQFTTSGTGTLTINSSGVGTAGTILVYGNVAASNTGTGGGGNAILQISENAGTPNPQALSGNGTLGGGALPIVSITKSTGQSLQLSGVYVSVGNNWTFSGTGTLNATTNGVTVVFTKTCTINSSTQSFHKLTFYPTDAATVYTISGTVNVGNALTISGTTDMTVSGGTLAVLGNVNCTNASAVTGGTATVSLQGTTAQIIDGNATAGGGALPNLTINQGAGGSVQLGNTTTNPTVTITLKGSFTYTAGTVTSGSNTTVAFAGTSTSVSALNIPFKHVTVRAGTTTLSTALTVNGNLTINSGATFTPGANAITLGGNWSNSGTFNAGTSTVTFNSGTSSQSITKSSGSETFYGVTVNKNGGNLTLSSPVTITNALTLTKGNVTSTSTNLLTLNDNLSMSGGSSLSFVTGPLKKIGNDVFTFPIGSSGTDGSYYHPLSITAPSSTTDAFTAEYVPVAQGYGTAVDTLIDSLDNCEYWTLSRVAGTSTVTPTLGWNTNSCKVNNVSAVAVAEWNGTEWNDLGASTITQNGSTGTVKAASSVAFNTATMPLTISRKKIFFTAGTYTVGGTSPNYSSFTAAISDMRGKFLTGNVYFSVRNGTYNESVDLGSTVQYYKHAPGAMVYFIPDNESSASVTLSGSGRLVNIDSKNGVHFYGINYSSSGSPSEVIYISNSSNITFAAGTIDNAGSADAAIRTNASTSILIEDASITGNFSKGIYMTGTSTMSGNSINACNIRSSVLPVYATKQGDFTLTNNVISSTSPSSVKTVHLLDITGISTVSGNTVSGYGDNIYLERSNSTLSLSNNTVTNTNGRSIFVRSFANTLTIEGNIINASDNLPASPVVLTSLAGIKIKEDSTASNDLDTVSSKRLTIAYNQVNQVKKGIDIFNVKKTDVVVYNNNIRSSYTGIISKSIDGNNTGLKAEGNRISVWDYGLVLDNNRVPCTVSFNTVAITPDTIIVDTLTMQTITLNSSDNITLCGNNAVNKNKNKVVTFDTYTPASLTTSWNNWYSYVSGTVSNYESRIMSSSDNKLNPLFEDLTSYKLSYKSPLLDKAIACLDDFSAIDIEGNPRETNCDMGAVESVPTGLDGTSINLVLDYGSVFYPDRIAGLPYRVFEIQGLGNYTTVNLRIYDRGGQLIYQSSSKTNFWSGQNSANVPVSKGAYRYELDLDSKTIGGYIYVER